MYFKELNTAEITPSSTLTKVYYSCERTLDAHLVALCADYDRRERVVRERSSTYRVIMTYKFLNYKILEAAISVAGNRDAPIFIKDIGNHIGYSDTEVALSESVYKLRKLDVKLAILRSLGLFDSGE